MTVVLLSIISISILYFLFAFLSVRICAICAAVSLTWLVLLIGLFLGWHNNVLWIAVMMGGSVVGFAYKLEKYFKKKKLSNFWLIRILVVVLGFLAVYLLLIQNWRLFGLVFVLGIVLTLLSLLFIKHRPSAKMQDEKVLKKKLDNLVQQLENCCED